MCSIQEKTQVVIVGGGEVGLATSILLSLQGIQHVLLERQPTTSNYPKAIGMHNRTMEIFRTMGLEEQVYRHSAPTGTCTRCTWVTSLAADGREIASREAFGYTLSDNERGRAYSQASPSRYCNFAQIRLEPILRKRAEELNPQGVLFHHEVTRVQEDPAHAVVTYHSRSGSLQDQIRTIGATYVVGADGGRFITKHLGLRYEGESDVADMVTGHIRAPLTKHIPDLSVLIHWFVNPRLGGSTNSGVLYHLGPYPRDPSTEEWSVIFGRLPHEREKPFTKDDMLSRLHKIFQIPDLEINLLSISHWFVQAKAASSYISSGGRVFLVGDAAHRIPPWGALGGNTGFQDAQNLAWKLALTLKSTGSMDFTDLLQTYDEERRPIGQRVAKMGLQNMLAHGDILDRVIGISPAKTEEENLAAMESYFMAVSNSSSSSTDGAIMEGKAKIEAVRKAAHETLDIEFFALGAEAGWFYNHSHIFDGEEWVSPQINPDGTMELCEYRPCTVPGHQLPHAWLRNSADERCSTRWLVKQDKFLMLTSSGCWRAVENDMVDLVVLDEGEWKDVDGEWARQRGVAPSGAVLVRPDNIVAWRWIDGGMLKRESDPSAELEKVLRRVLRLS